MSATKSALIATVISAILSGASLLTPARVAAMGVSPIQVEMQSAGGQSRGTVTVMNSGNAPLPVDVAIKRMTQDENGVRKFFDDAQNDFLILPPQAMIPPGGSQVFRIQWVGEPMLEQSKSFMFFANEIPVKMPNNASGVQMVSSMGAMVNVAPPKGQPDLRVVTAGVEVDKKSGKRQATVVVENPTKTHALLPKSVLRLQAGNWTETLEPGELASKIGIGLVPPGQRRKFVLPVNVPQGVTSLQASIEYGIRRQ
jgi:fimbrial chaperone protein